ncbi:hypothetical protein F4823DRAFT_90972 [Ustulina deusta]|nr:hypothetical protein F4823DRAFT_90972 [Ustulina deusta]
MESTPRRRYPTHFTEEGEESLRSKRSSITIEWSDGSKVIFIRPPRPRSSLGWVSPHVSSPSPSPPPISLSPTPAPALNSQRSRTPQTQHVDADQAESSGISRPGYSGVRQGTPRPSRGGNEGPPSSHSEHTPSARPSMQPGGISTPQPRAPASNSLYGPNIDRPQSAPIHNPNISDDRDGHGRAIFDRTSTDAVVGRMSSVSRRSGHRHDQSGSQSQLHDEQLQHEPGQGGADQGRPASLPPETTIRGGSGRSPRRGRAGERSVRSGDGSGGFGSSRRDEGGDRGDRSGDVLRGLRRCFPFSYWLFGEIGDDHRHENRSRPGSRSRRTGRR